MPSILTKIDHTKIDVAEAFAYLQHPEAGGIDIFIGTTRGITDGIETVELAYEGYEPMALAEMDNLLNQAGEKWPVIKACLFHRLGLVPAGEPSVIVGIATAHRAEAFEACRFVIDNLKQQVPIWKKEIYTDGKNQWVEGAKPPKV